MSYIEEVDLCHKGKEINEKIKRLFPLMVFIKEKTFIQNNSRLSPGLSVGVYKKYFF